MLNFKTDEEARAYYASHGLTDRSTASEIIAVNPQLGEVSRDPEHVGWKLRMVDGIPGFVL